MPPKEAKARIKINNLLQESGWRLLDDSTGLANVVLENNVKITHTVADDMGEDYEKTSNGYADYLLLDEKGFPLIVLEAKSEDKNPLVGKEQARKYARAQNCGYVILSNGNMHYFWDIEKSNPTIITKYPTQKSIKDYTAYKPQPDRLINEKIFEDYIAITQKPNYCEVPEYKDKNTREQFVQANKLRFLREYQVKAVKALQESVRKGNERFLFEMATGTGKTLVSAAVIKLFLRTGNAKRVLFLVDRLELEIQADKAFNEYLKNDCKTIIYKERRDDWRHAEIVVTTVQSLLFNNKFTRLFSPTDFDLVISDEAHRSIGGNARALFEYFIGYKLGLTATPKDYLKRFDAKNPSRNDPREYERRLLLDTYRTFGCETGTPTFRYSLIEGVNEDFLINPVVVDARTDVTTQLLSDKGYAVLIPVEDEGGEKEEEQSFFQKDFEKKFFSDDTNTVFCKAFLDNALRDPITGEIGKTIIFAVSQNHAAKIAQKLNELAHLLFPGRYNSDFALQVTSLVQGAQQYTLNFSDKSNNLSGTANFLPWYRTSKTRVCVTVGMMTTGYDCTDILNICLMRPIFSPTDFIQIKGRGTRKHNFTVQVTDPSRAKEIGKVEKEKFKLFDFFGNYEYFEEKFQYDQVLKLPYGKKKESPGPGPEPHPMPPDYELFDPDILYPVNEIAIGLQGMKIDRMFFDRFGETVKKDEVVVQSLEEGNWDKILDHINREILNKPEDFYTIEKLRKSINTDRRVTLREIVEYIFGLIPFIKSKEELLDEEFNKFITDCKPGEKDDIIALKYFFKSYITDGKLRDIIESKKYAELNVNPSFSTKDFKAVSEQWRFAIPEYIKDYVPLNKFTN
ncbi:MAG TPA: DEAD/DEAH box helicase family protein [Bacteroidales bacterium]|nr:DEAD/DEAH box helicase family protein [Bacteroidales bacterium]